MSLEGHFAIDPYYSTIGEGLHYCLLATNSNESQMSNLLSKRIQCNKSMFVFTNLSQTQVKTCDTHCLLGSNTSIK